MSVALDEARTALRNGDLPVGAVLTVADRIMAREHNRIISDKSLVAHAENLLLTRNSRLLFDSLPSSVVIYTTLEPCLMCLSAAIHSHVKKIVYACHDPHGGAIAAIPLNGWYKQNWPVLEHDPLHERQAAEILLTFSHSRPIWRERFKGLLEK